ncbi:MAG: iron-sulfur cluster repair di-iron protein [Thermoanaerobaculia bacterium]
MELNHQTPVGDIAVAYPDARRIFEKAGIDYCCGGKRPLVDACTHANVPVSDVLQSLAAVTTPQQVSGETDWSKQSLASLMKFILDTHHVFTRDELVRLAALTKKVHGVHGANHPELDTVAAIFQKIHDDLFPHMMKEEQILFPYIEQMEGAILEGRYPEPPFFGTVRNPIQMMSMEHDAVGELLRELRKVTDGYQAPADGCISYKTLYGALEELERDLHQHIHLENNMLFPRAVAMEAETLEKADW